MIMTIEQAFNVAMNEYPSLWTASTLELAKLKFYDHVFNTIGNGLHTANEFESEFTITDENKHLIDTFPEKYITSAPLYSVGTKNALNQMCYISGLYTEAEAKELLRTGHFYHQSNRNSDYFVPYPNFDVEYSLVHNIDLSEYDPSWTIAAIYYYLEMRGWFKSDSVSNYPHASHLKDMQSSINSYEQVFKRYAGDATTTEERNANITRAYGIPYIGDTEQFIHARWNTELNRINAFIDETLVKLQQ